jgi:hypothetical protein
MKNKPYYSAGTNDVNLNFNGEREKRLTKPRNCQKANSKEEIE